MGEISLDWKEKSISDSLITGGIFIFELFMLLVFCEIIELNFWGLKENTKKNIEERAEIAVFDENGCDSNLIGEGIELAVEEDNSSFNNSFNENN